MRIYTQYDPPPAVKLTCTDNKTRESEAKALDVNKIVQRFAQTGVLPHRSDGLFLDVSQVTDYREALEQVQMADMAFMKLNAEIRAHFKNDPALFLDAVIDPSRRKELEDLKIFEPEVVKAAEPPIPPS